MLYKNTLKRLYFELLHWNIKLKDNDQVATKPKPSEASDWHLETEIYKEFVENYSINL